jgi:hypothetical protein
LDAQLKAHSEKKLNRTKPDELRTGPLIAFNVMLTEEF